MAQLKQARSNRNGETDAVFAGSVARIYDEYMVPLIFEFYAADLARRVQSARPSRVLEIAAGTGVVTRAMTTALPNDVSIIATDLNETMLAQASANGTKRPVEWRQADAMQLPFEDESFDAVVCQFGAMFFPDKPTAYSEVLRVLRPGGVFIFNVWDRIEENEFADVVTSAMASIYPGNPPQFLARTPHGYFERHKIEADIAHAGFSHNPAFETIAARSRAASCCSPAIAYCEGTPLKNELEARNHVPLREATGIAARAIAARFGEGEVDGKMQAHVISVAK